MVKSSSPDWDYEVTTGIWTLRVRSDGTFQAEHEGNVFTYRLHSIGLGRGTQYRPFEWGEPNWSNTSVMGDTIRWAGVFPDVDLSVRYIHDILKVDVILKRALMDRIRSDVNNGFLNREEYLTARFDIPNALVTGEARQGGRMRDIFAEPFELNQPLEILKHDKVVHKIRPVETYVIDDQGQEIIVDESPIRSAQWWQLRKNGPGVAEMSALLGDMADAPEGIVVMDPVMQLLDYPLKDTCLIERDPNYSCGGDDALYWTSHDHVMLSWLVPETIIPSSCPIDTAKIEFYIHGVYDGFTSNTIQSHLVPETWAENATWNKRILNPSTYWQYPGAINLSAPPTPGRTCILNSGGAKEIDVTNPFKSYFPNNRSYLSDRGFLLRMTNRDIPGYAIVYTKEHINTNLRAKLIVNLKARAQGTAHYPFLKRRDGNKNNVNDRWFPIGTYFNLEAIDPAHSSGWPSGNVESMAQKPYGYYFNFIYPLEKIDERNKSIVWDNNFVASVGEYSTMLTKMNNVATQYGVDYKMLPTVTDKLVKPDLITYYRENPGFNGSYPWYIFSESSYYPSGFSWSNEDQQIQALVIAIQSHARVWGWHFGDEPYGGKTAQNYETNNPENPSYDPVTKTSSEIYPGFRQYLHDCLENYIGDVQGIDTQYQHPSYLNLRHWGNYFYGVNGDNVLPLPSYWRNMLDIQDYILDSSLYRLDIERLSHKPWENGVYVAESAIINAISQGYGKGYGRFIACRDILPDFFLEQAKYEKERYLAYSSWVCGGQGLFFFRYDHNTTDKWFGDDVSPLGDGISGRLLTEAYIMRNWLMNAPSTDITGAYGYDSLGSPRVRFILRRDQTGLDNRILVLFCNFANDGLSHNTYIHFPNNTITSIQKIVSHLDGTFSLENSNKTIKFVPNFPNADSYSVYGSACFITLQ